ncbi:MAG: L,D-transpeptidase [Gammaproteobacteria bacterium]|nr:L,D-transpeptidase [Gammaproteobacteria bacterium]MDH5736446.1 L,D-transpeptidase [Gammaproteobacteria bacterium]
MTSSRVDIILIRISEQRLYLLDEKDQVLVEYPVSTSLYGTGNQQDSYQTPLGLHRIKEKIGDGMPAGEVFIGRQPQGLLDDLIANNVGLSEDIITSRILWLEGLQAGINQGGDVDTYQRYIYIHGTVDEDSIGHPASHGCIRMRNQDVIDLYDRVDIGCAVNIID